MLLMLCINHSSFGEEVELCVEFAVGREDEENRTKGKGIRLIGFQKKISA